MYLRWGRVGKERTYSRSKSEFQVVRAKSIIVNGGINNFFQKLRFAEEIFRHAEPKAEKLFLGNDMLE